MSDSGYDYYLTIARKMKGTKESAKIMESGSDMSGEGFDDYQSCSNKTNPDQEL